MDLNALIEELERRGDIVMDPAVKNERFVETTDSPLLGDAPAEEVLCLQQPQPDPPMPQGAAPASLQQPFLPAPGLDAAPGPSRYPPPIVMPPGLWYNQAAPCSQQQFNNVPVVSLPQDLGNNLVPIGFVNGQVIYHYPASTAPVMAPYNPPVNRPPPVKRRFHRQPNPEKMAYVKKPPNAFMIFLKEQRPRVVAELGNSDCAAVNKIIGQRWKSLSNNEQIKYYDEAEKEMQLHNYLFPEWTAADNYGRKRKRIRRKGPAETGEPDS